MIYCLLIKREQDISFKPYGFGEMPYIIELLNNYLNVCKMYNYRSVEFKVIEKDEFIGEKTYVS